MKKSSMIVLAAVSLVSISAANAATSGNVCTGNTVATNGTQISSSTSATNEFVKQSFTPKCSANVFLSYEQDQINFGVGAGSSKGKTAFKGNTGGGAVSARGACTGTGGGCQQSDATGAATVALQEAGSS